MEAGPGNYLTGFRPSSGALHKARHLPFYLKTVKLKFLTSGTSEELPMVWQKDKHVGELRDRFHFRYANFQTDSLTRCLFAQTHDHTF